MARRFFGLLLVVGFLLTATVTAATAQTDAVEPANCGTYEGVVCRGWFSDDAEVVEDDAVIESAVGALVARYGKQIAVVTVTESPYGTPLEFAQDLGNAWGVGDAQRQDGIVCGLSYFIVFSHWHYFVFCLDL